MKGLMSRRPSPAMVVAIVALVVAMVGTGYAATKLPKNSVGTKQIKAKAITTAKLRKNSVTSAKIRKKTITGADINLNKLGTVPSANVANTANVANVANSLAPPEPVRFVGAPGQPGFLNGSSNFGGTSGINTQAVGFWKDHEGVVHLQGLLKTGAGGPVAFTLPPGYRPASGTVLFFNVFCSGAGCAEEGKVQSGTLLVAGSSTSTEGVDLSGGVVTIAVAETAVSLDGITFRAAS